jgi:hypothetical protein
MAVSVFVIAQMMPTVKSSSRKAVGISPGAGRWPANSRPSLK